ncbi:MAG: YdcF family protein [Lysobacter sp.]
MLVDRDVWHSLAVAGAACVLSAGLVYVGYFIHVLRVARSAPCVPARGECVLLFGKHAPGGRMDRDFEARLDRVVSLWRERPLSRVVLLGGGAPGDPTEAALARDGLLARGWATEVPLQLEARSRDTMQNLRNARRLLGGPATGLATGDEDLTVRGRVPVLPVSPATLQVTLLSSRYHLARCALFARQLGFDAELCAAEPRLRLGLRTLLRLAGEAAYVCWSDLGTRWARLIDHRRMLDRVT